MKKVEIDPMVSICCITYNHVSYISKALDGFLNQKTNFPIEILIHDDASTDGTEEIIKKYTSKYPNIIFPVLQKENKYSSGIPINASFNFPRARGKYIAMCEGDDYWIDENKLQWQIDFLEKNTDVAACTHEVLVNNDTGKDVRSFKRKAGVLYRYFCLYGLMKAFGVVLSSFKNNDAIESFDITHRNCLRKKNGEIYKLKDFSDGKTHMSMCSIVIRKRVIDSHIKIFHLTPRGGHQSLLIMSAVSGGIAHFYQISGVKNNQATSVTQSPERKLLNKKLALNPKTNDKLNRYIYFFDKVSSEEQEVLARMIEKENEKINRLLEVSHTA